MKSSSDTYKLPANIKTSYNLTIIGDLDNIQYEIENNK